MMEIYANQRINPTSRQCSVHTARRDTFIFLKSNYKYKRRDQKHQYHNMTASQCRGNAIIGNISSDNSAAAMECDSINEVIKDTWTRWKWQKIICNTYAMLLRMLLLIISNAWKPRGGKQQQKRHQQQRKQQQQQRQNITKCNRKTINNCKKIIEREQLATFATASFTDDVNDEMDFQRNDVKVLRATSIARKMHAPIMSSARSSTSLTTSSSTTRSIGSFDAPTPMTMRPSSFSSPTKLTLSSLSPVGVTCSGAPLRISDKLFTFFAALFIAFAFCARSVAAGACWQTALDTGKCNEIYSLNITKAECCGRSQEFSYTDRDLTEVEYFFATAIGGGMECSPCIESCKSIECGANKKCVKRKGRPKCICAPECGAAARRRRQQQQLYRGHLHHSEQLPRDIRSLSSEITNFNLGLDTRGDVGANNSHRRNQNQRKTPTLPSQRNHQHHYHQQQQQQQQQLQQQQQNHNHHRNQKRNHHNQQEQQERPLEVKASKRLVIIANVDPKGYRERSTTRRIQIVGNMEKTPRSQKTSDLITSSVNQTTTTSIDEDILKSRRKSEENISKNDNDMSNNEKCNENVEFNRNKCNTKNRLRHRHRKFNLNKSVDDDIATSGFDDIDGQQSPQHRGRILQRGRLCHLHRHHQHHYQNHHRRRQREHFYQHQHQHRCRQKQKQKLQLERQQKKQQKLKDRRQQQESNKTTMSMQMLPANGATFLKPASGPSSSSSSSSPSSSSASSLPSKTKTTTTTATTITIAETTTSTTTTGQQSRQQNVNPQTSMVSQTAAFAANSATSLLSALPGRVVIADRQHSLNHGSISAASSSQSLLGHETSLSTLSPSTEESQSESIAKVSTKVDKVRDNDGVDVEKNIASNSFQRNDEFALLDGYSHDLNLQQFPDQQNGNSDFEIIRHNYHPVCGTDGRTYNTECKLKKRACRTNNQNLHVAYRGHCKTSCNGVQCLNGLKCVEDHYMLPHCIACKIECPEDEVDASSVTSKSSNRRIIIDPSRAVCGVDGKTYKSICDINRMVCKIGRSIAVAYPGPCRTDRITCSDINCGPKQTCLVDLLTHEPRCVSCRYKCARKRHPTALRYEEGKICGVNNRSYNSWCEMRRDSCTTGFFIDVKAVGECQ